MINMFNVKAFLEDGVFVAPDQARKDARGVAEPVVEGVFVTVVAVVAVVVNNDGEERGRVAERWRSESKGPFAT